VIYILRFKDSYKLGKMETLEGARVLSIGLPPPSTVLFSDISHKKALKKYLEGFLLIYPFYLNK
jgi:hypothetical protein